MGVSCFHESLACCATLFDLFHLELFQKRPCADLNEPFLAARPVHREKQHVRTLRRNPFGGVSPQTAISGLCATDESQGAISPCPPRLHTDSLFRLVTGKSTALWSTTRRRSRQEVGDSSADGRPA